MFIAPPSDDEMRRMEEIAQIHNISYAAVVHQVLSSPDILECQKIGMRIIVATRKFTEHASKVLLAYANAGDDIEACERNLPLRQDVLEYIALMEAGLNIFVQHHPAPTESNEVEGEEENE